MDRPRSSNAALDTSRPQKSAESSYMMHTGSSAQRRRRSNSTDPPLVVSKPPPLPQGIPSKAASREGPHLRSGKQSSTVVKAGPRPARANRLMVMLRLIDGRSTKRHTSDSTTLPDDDDIVCCKVDKSITISSTSVCLRCDDIFASSDSVMTVSDELIPQILRHALDGRPCTVIAVGMTRAGKSTTLFGDEGLVLAHIQQIMGELATQRLDCALRVVLSMACVHPGGVTDLLLEEDDETNLVGPQELKRCIVSSVAQASLVIARARSHPTVLSTIHNLITIVSVVPECTQDGANRLNLLRRVAPVAFVELNGGKQRRTAANEDDVEQGIRDDTRAVLSLLEAGVRSPHTGAGKGSYTSALLTDFIVPRTQAESDPHCILLVHLDRLRPGPSMASFLSVAEWLLKAKYPSGIPAPDFEAIAHRQQTLITSLQAKLQDDSLHKDEALNGLRRDNFALLKAYEAACARIRALEGHKRPHERWRAPPELTPVKTHHSNIVPSGPSPLSINDSQRVIDPSDRHMHPPHGSDEQSPIPSAPTHDEDTLVLRLQVQRLNELLVAAEHEVSVLRAQLHSASFQSREQRSTPLIAPRPGEVTPRSITAVPLGSPSCSTLDPDALSLGTALRDTIHTLERHGVFDEQAVLTRLEADSRLDLHALLKAARNAIDALARQCCERERAFETLVRRVAVEDILGNIVQTPVGELTPPVAHRMSRVDRHRVDLHRAPLLGWQKWRDVLHELGDGRENAYVSGTRGSYLRVVVPDRSTDFYRWWSTVTPFGDASDSRSPSQNAAAAASSPAEASPASRLDLLFAQTAAD